MAKLPVSGQQSFDDINPDEHQKLIEAYSALPSHQILMIDVRAIALRKTHHIPLLHALFRAIKELQYGPSME